MGRYLIGAIVAIIIVVIAVIIASVLAVSYSNIEYYEMGFKVTSGEVDTSEVYYEGHHLVGPNTDFIKYPAGVFSWHLPQISVFSKDRLGMEITVTFQYSLRPRDLKYIHELYPTNYTDEVKDKAIHAIKFAVTEVTMRDMFTQRAKFEEVLYKAVRTDVGGECCSNNCTDYKMACPEGCTPYTECNEVNKLGRFVDVTTFQLHDVSASAVEARFLMQKTLHLETKLEELLQDIVIVEKQTEQELQQQLLNQGR